MDRNRNFWICAMNSETLGAIINYTYLNNEYILDEISNTSINVTRIKMGLWNEVKRPEQIFNSRDP